MKFAFDTNILVYATGLNDAVRHSRSVALLGALSDGGGVIAAQALAEYHRVLTVKYRQDAEEVLTRILRFRRVYEIPPTTSDCIVEAAALANRHNLQIFDAIIIAASAEAGCRVLFSEDMRHEAVFNGLTIVNPFAEPKHPMLAAALK